MEKSLSKGIKEGWFYVLVLFAWLVTKDRYDFQYIDTGTFWCGFILMWYWVITNMFENWKYKSSQFVADNFHGSCVEKPAIIGDYAIFRIGGYKAHGFHDKGNDSCVVIPKTMYDKTGDNYFSTVKVLLKDIREVPYLVKEELITASYNIENIFFGRHDKDFNLSNPDINKLKEELADTNDVLTTLKGILKGKNDEIEKAVAFASRIADKSKRKSMLDFLGGLKEEDEK